MVSLSNQARLLAAQAFNKKVLEDKARAKQAEIDAEARAQEQKRFQRQRDLLAKQTATQSANVRAFQEQRLEDDIRKQQATAKEKARVALIRKQAEAEKAKVFTRVAKGADIGVLTGFEAQKNTSGQIIGISNRESATRKNTRALLIREIEQQRKIASRETDLERFLKNERAINAGQVSSAELNKQIAQRKARGLSKTPAQKRASQGFRDFGLQTALSARSKTKPRGLTATFGSITSERARASALGSDPFADPLFAGGGRTSKEIIARGGTFGRRVGGQSITNQLGFISSVKAKSTSGRINFASSLLAGLGSGGIFSSGGSSQNFLLGIVSQKSIATPKTFEAELRSGVGFFTTVAKPVTKAKITKGQRATLVSNRKAEDKAIADSSRARIQATKSQTKARQVSRSDDLSRLSDNLLAFNTQRGSAIESQNAQRSPRFSLGNFGFDSGTTTQRQQAQSPKSLSLIPTRSIFTGVTERVAKGSKLTPSQKRKQAEATQRETQLLRDTPFQVGSLVQATGRPSSTETFFPSLPAERERGIFDVNLSENLGISDILDPTRTQATTTATTRTKGKKVKKATKTQTPQQTVINIGGGSGGSGQAQSIDFGFGISGVGEALSGVTSGVSNFFAIPTSRVADVDFSDPILQGGISSGGTLLKSALPKSLQNLFG